MGVLDGWQFCPRCRGDLRHDRGRVDCGRCGFVAYANSAPTASAVCIDDEGRMLLARRAGEPFMGRWDIPGGFLEEGEHPLDALAREFQEETGLAIEPGEFLGVFMDWYGEPDTPGLQSTLNLTWLARVVAGEPEPADDVAELRWFAPDDLPRPDELAFRSLGDVLSAVLAARQQQA